MSLDEKRERVTKNDFKKAAQEKKAHALAHLLLDWDFSSSQVAQIDPEFRKPLAQAAEVNPPSEETWDIVIDIVASVEASRLSTVDPFAGLN